MRTLYWAAAASIILILGTVFYFQNISTPETLYAKYAAHDELALTVRGEEDSLKLQAEIHFNNGQFEIAADILGELHQRYLENTDITLYLAIALIESRQHIRARTLLREVQKSGSVFGDKATWYLALSYLKEDKVDECKAVLKDISKESPMYKEATQLLKEL